MKKLVFTAFAVIGFLFTSNCQEILVGAQIWSSKNLDVSNFRTGDPIQQAKTNLEWQKAGDNKQPAWCYYNNDATKGKLYNWYAVVDIRGLAPKGWHIPSFQEWVNLIGFLGGQDIAGKKIKNSSGWDDIIIIKSKTCPNCATWSAEYRSKVACHTCKDSRLVPATKVTYSGNGSNDSGFKGLPCGKRDLVGNFEDIGKDGYFWSTKQDGNRDNGYAWVFSISNNSNSLLKSYSNKYDGFSVRCIKD